MAWWRLKSRTGSRFRLKAMLRECGWTQQALAERAGTAQPLISKYLNGYENYSLQTLKKLASGFDVGLIISFASFSEIVDRYMARSYTSIAIPSYADDKRLRAPSGIISTRTADKVVSQFDLTARQLPLLNGETTSARIIYLDEIRQARRITISSTTAERPYAQAHA